MSLIHAARAGSSSEVLTSLQAACDAPRDGRQGVALDNAILGISRYRLVRAL